MKKVIFMLTALMCLFFNSCTIVDSGEIGIEFHKWSSDDSNYGGVKGTCRGWVFFNPFTTSVFTYPTYIQRKNYEPFTVNAKDASTFTMDPTIAYSIDPGKAPQIFTKYRKDIKDLENGYIRTCIFEAYRTCANSYTSDSLMSSRANFENDVRARLTKSLNDEGFIVSEFTSQITPPTSLQAAIDSKNKAIQESLKATNEVKKAEAQARIAIAEAEGNAKAMKIKADAEAYCNRTIAASLNELLIKQDIISKWNGVLPQVSGNNTPFINLK